MEVRDIDRAVLDGFDAIAGIQGRYPGTRISRTSSVDVHHGIARFAWRFVLADGSSFPEGLDIAFLMPIRRA